ARALSSVIAAVREPLPWGRGLPSSAPVRSLPLSLFALILAGCAQLVLFEQPIIGQPDVIPGPASRGELLCDEDVALGRSALCDASCTLEAGSTEHGCGERLTLTEAGAVLDVRGLREVELTVTACAPIARTALIESSSGANVVLA